MVNTVIEGSTAVANFAEVDEVTMSEELLQERGERADRSGSSLLGETVQECEVLDSKVLPGEKNVESKGM